MFDEFISLSTYLQNLTEVIEQPATFIISDFFLEAFGTPFIYVYTVFISRG